MTSNLLKTLLLCLVIQFFLPAASQAQESVTLSISPTLYDMSAEPGQEWKSTLKIINVNKFDLTVYAEVVNFTPRGEGGDGRFIPIEKAEATGATLAEWFTISSDPITISREQSIEIPFSVKVPEDASPGGHFAAILVGTKPPESVSGQARLQTAQVVTSLFFAKVAGDVVEAGNIREFLTTKSLLGTPEVTFSLRFENKGNVHLQPRGDIKIFNMWGEERGTIPINQYTNFGNVLPDSIRKFLFTWKGEWSPSDIGRYTAIATLGYGSDEKKFTSAETVFWVLPLKFMSLVMIGLVLFFGLLTWLVRLYVKHMLMLAGISIEDYQTVQDRVKTRPKSKPIIHGPMQAGILDLTRRMQTSVSLRSRLSEILSFVIQYRLFFLGVVLIVTFILIIIWYVKGANTEHRAYEVEYMQNDSVVTTAVNSEEIIYNQLIANETSEQKMVSSTSTEKISIVNRSGTPGIGAKVKILLEKVDFEVVSLTADFKDIQTRTVIVTNAKNYSEAVKISQKLLNAPVSVDNTVTSIEPIIIYVGSDLDH